MGTDEGRNRPPINLATGCANPPSQPVQPGATGEASRRLPSTGGSPQRPLDVCAVRRRRFPVGASPTRRPLQPEATGAVMEVTKWLAFGVAGHV